MKNMNDIDKLDIALRVSNGEHKSDLAKEYNISYSTVNNICNDYGLNTHRVSAETKAAVLQHYSIYHNIRKAARDCGISCAWARTIIQNSNK